MDQMNPFHFLLLLHRIRKENVRTHLERLEEEGRRKVRRRRRVERCGRSSFQIMGNG